MSEPISSCDRYREDLAAWIDGDVTREAADHLASCDACRDLRHEARRIARVVPRAGADYVAPDPDALAARVLAALDARPTVAARSVATPPHGTQVVVAPANTTAAVSPDAPPPTAPIAHAPHEVVRPLTVTPVAPLRLGRVFAFAGVGVAAAAAAGVLGVVMLGDAKRDKPDAPVATVRANAPWSARVARVLRASSDATGGLEVLAPGASAYVRAQERTQIAAGTRLRTDGKTRCRLELDDGSVLVLDRATELVLDASAPRSASLVSGNLVADVAHRGPGEVARIATPAGPVEVLGTRFALAATSDRTNVRVARGVVKLGVSPQVAEVKTGQEASLSRADGVSVAPAVGLAGAVSWADLGTDASDAPVLGIGELRARRPGSTTERDEAVHMASHTVKVRIVGNVARTEIEEVFRNDTAQELEGVYRFPLPPEAQIETLALDVDGRMEPGSFVDRDRAAAIWRGVIRHATPRPRPTTEEFVWVPGPWHDPALLEWQRGGRFELRIFPIPARGARRVTLSYTQTIAPSGTARRYVYPLAHNPDGSTRVDQFSLDVQVMGHDRARPVQITGYPLVPAVDTGAADHRIFAQQSFVPSGDLVVEYALPDARAQLTAWTYQPPAAPGAPAEAPYVTFAVRPTIPRWGDARPRDYVFVVDASRSMVGERIVRATRLVGAAVSEMDRRDRFTVLACDTRCRSMGAMQLASEQGAAAAGQFVAAVEPAGATDLVGAVREAMRAAAVNPDASRDVRVVYLGDGASSVGWRSPDRIAAEVSEALPEGRATVTTVAIGTDADTTTLAAMARGGGGAMVPYAPGERVRAAALSLLEATYGMTLRDPQVILPPGISAMAPAKLASIRAGSEALITARMDRPDVSGEIVLRGTVAGDAFEARYPINLRASDSAGNAFVPRQHAAARIADLEGVGGPSTRAEIVALSQRHRVASRYTSLLVLESAAMFRAFGVERNTASVAWTGEAASEGTVLAGAAPEPELAAATADEESPPAPLANNTPVGALAAGHGRGSGSGFGARASAPMAQRERSDNAGAVVDGVLTAGDDDLEQRRAGPSTAVARTRAPMRSWGWMRRVWVRRASIANTPHTVAENELDPTFAQRAARAREALGANPDSRDRHRELLRWLALGGDVDEADALARRWAVRDPLDVDAITRAADVAARSGDRERSLRMLSGVLDVRPDDVAAHERMALTYERMADAERACSYRVSIAEVRATDASALARAVRCLRATGHDRSALRVLNSVADLALRTRVEAEAATLTAASEGDVRGDLTLHATWEGADDLDVAVIDPRGVRLSWQGGRANITARQATSGGAESLGLPRLATGDHVIEITRAAPGRAVVQGRVTLRVLGQTRTVPFTLTEEGARVARVTITRESQLVPTDR